MAVTLRMRPKVRSANGKYEATARTLQVNIAIDLTQGNSATKERILRVLEAIVAGTETALVEEGLTDAKVGGDWAWVYGPWWSGELA